MAITRWFAQRISDYDTPSSVGSSFRARRIEPFLRMIERLSDLSGRVNVIDVGGMPNYWNIVAPDFFSNQNVRITIVNLPGVKMEATSPWLSFCEADACSLSEFGDGEFDLAHSNSVLEHVGDWDSMVRFAREIARVAEGYFVQTPNYWFPLEPHCMTPFFHWLPKPVRLRLVRRFQLGHWKRAESADEGMQIVESARLVNRPMFEALFPDAEIGTERVLGLPKSFVALKHPARLA